MRKTIKFLWCVFLVVSLLILGALLADKKYLQENIVRLHVRANSDSIADQQEKLAVRDELLQFLSVSMPAFQNPQDAKLCLENNITTIQDHINEFLYQRGSTHEAQLSLRKEAFDTRDYNTFRLPAGVYDSLIIEIGSGEGANWWCVVFPSLCLQDFYTAAASVDMNDGIQETLAGEEKTRVRFFLLECLGKLENFFYKS